MEYKSVKVGDVVLISVDVKYGFGSSKSFRIYKKVERVTPKQFIVDNRRFRKIDGHEMGSSFSRVYKAGEKIGWNGEEVIVDQLNNMVYFRKKVKALNEIENYINFKTLSVDLPLKTLEEVKDNWKKYKDSYNKALKDSEEDQ